MSFPSYNDLSLFSPSQGDELQQFISYLQGFLSAQHKDDGSHSAITADSISVTGDVTIGGAENVTGTGNFGGDVVSLFKSGNECGIGTLATINGVALEGSEAIRTGLLLGGIAHGVWWEQRAAGSPFTSNYEWRCWLLDWDNTTAALRFGIISGRPTLMDGGTGSTAIDVGAVTRPLHNVHIGGSIPTYQGVGTSGWGIPSIYASGQAIGQTASVGVMTSYVVGVADGSFWVSAWVIENSGTGLVSVDVTYTTPSSATETLTLASISAGPGFDKAGTPFHIRAKANSTITIATTVTGTINYDAEGCIAQIR